MGTRILRLVKSTNCTHKYSQLLYNRCNGYASQGSDKNTPEKGEHLQPLGGVKTFFLKKYLSYIQRFELKVEKHYPKFYKIYRLFKDGIGEFFNDAKVYSVIATRIWTGEELAAFTWKELEIYRQMPSHLMKSAPVLIAAPLPAVPYFFYPICYLFPRQLLCQYFWTTEQQHEFGVHYLRQRLQFFPKILELLERRCIDVRDVALRQICQDILFKLEHDTHPTIEELLEVKDLFIHHPFGMGKAPKIHMWYIARSFGFSTFSHKRFKNDAILLHNIDLAMVRSGVHSLSMNQLQQSCFYRGYNPENQSKEQLEQYLMQWVELSQQIDESSLSLLLHAPVFLSYNKPTNKKYLISEVDVRDSGRS